MRNAPIVILATLLLLVTACTKKPDENRINAETQAYWQPCTALKATPVTIESSNGKLVRFSYKVVMLKDGSDVTQSDCPTKNSSLLEAMSHEDMVNLKRNQEVEFTVEKSY